MNKKEVALQKQELNTFGISIGNITNTKTSASDRLSLCLIRGILIFLASMGTIGGVVSAFDIPYKVWLVWPVVLITTIYISLIYYNKLTFYLGYILFFVAFVIFSISLYLYTNSGFQAFLNIIFEKYSDYYALPTLREGYEFIKDRNITISVTMIFVCAVYSLLLNITISGYMSLIGTFIMTFPVLQIAFYIDKKPNILYLIMLICCYITVGILHRSSHYSLSSIKEPNRQYFTKRKNSNQYHYYSNNGHGILVSAIYVFIFSTVFLLICTNIFYPNFNTKYVNNKLKSKTDEYVKIIVQGSIFNLFNRYSATGGLSSGQLGGVSRITPDYNTDLVVSFVPLDSSAVYLKGFIGTYYIGNSFTSDTTKITDNTYGNPKAAYSFSEYTHPTGNYRKMYISNIDGSPQYDCMPYDAIAQIKNNHFYSINDSASNTANDLYEPNDDTTYSTSDAYGNYTVIYDPYVESIGFKASSDMSKEYENEIYTTYLEVPAELHSTLDAICSEQGIAPYCGSGDYEDKRGYTMATLGKLKAYFANNFEYSMAPGATPRNTDFVEYFLTIQKRGFCAHFAASGTLLLRELGIPARYIEGYCITSDTMSNARLVEEDITGWVNSNSDLDASKLGVLQIDVPDANAHAWVEVYIDGYGWIPYEFTPPYSGDQQTAFNLGDLFRDLVLTSPENNNNNATNTNNANEFVFNFSTSLGFIVKPLIAILGSALFLTIVLINAKPFFRSIKKQIYISKMNYNKAIIMDYQVFYQKACKRNLIIHHSLLRDNHIFFEQRLGKASADMLIDTINKAAYSSMNCSKEEYTAVIKCFKRLLKKS